MQPQGILKYYSDKMFHPHPLSELQNLRDAGKVIPIAGFPCAFEEIKPSPKANAPEDLDSVPDEDPKVYATKVMTAEKPATRRPRARRDKPSAQPKDVA